MIMWKHRHSNFNLDTDSIQFHLLKRKFKMYAQFIRQLDTMLRSPKKNKLFLTQFAQQGKAHEHLTPDVLFRLSIASTFAHLVQNTDFINKVIALNSDMFEQSADDVENKETYLKKYNKKLKKHTTLNKEERQMQLSKIANLMNTTNPALVEQHKELEEIALDLYDDLNNICPNFTQYLQELELEDLFNTENLTISKVDEKALFSRFSKLILLTLDSYIDVFPKTYLKVKEELENMEYKDYLEFLDKIEMDFINDLIEYPNVLQKNEESKEIKDELSKHDWNKLYMYQMVFLIYNTFKQFLFCRKQSYYTVVLNGKVKEINEIFQSES